MRGMRLKGLLRRRGKLLKALDDRIEAVAGIIRDVVSKN